MEYLYQYILSELWESTNEETVRLLHFKKAYKKRTINLFVFVIFIIAIAFYATINLLLMSFVILLFLYWIAQVQIFSTRRQLQDPKIRANIYFNQAQKLLQRKKNDAALKVYQNYTMRDENLDNIKLYIITLFCNKRWTDIVQLMKKYPIKNDDLILLYKYSLLQMKEYDTLESILNTSEIDYVIKKWMRNESIDESNISNNDIQKIIEHGK